MSVVFSYDASSGSESRLTSWTSRSAWSPLLRDSLPMRSRGPGGSPSSPPQSAKTGGLTDASRPRSLAHSPTKRTTSPGSVDPATTWSRRAEGGDLGTREGVLAGGVGQGAQLVLQQQRQLRDVARCFAVAVRVVERELALHLTDLDRQLDVEVGEFVVERLGDRAGRVRPPLADDLDADQRRAGVDHRLGVPAVTGVHRQAGVGLAGGAVRVQDLEVEGLVRAAGVVIDGDPEAGAPDARLLGVHLQHRALAVPLGRLQGDAGFLAAAGLRDPDDHGDGAAVAEELVDGVTDRALRGQSAEAALEVGEAGDPDRLIERAAPGVAHEGGHGRGDGGDAADAAGKLFDIDAGIGRMCRHSPSNPFRHRV